MVLRSPPPKPQAPNPPGYHSVGAGANVATIYEFALFAAVVLAVAAVFAFVKWLGA